MRRAAMQPNPGVIEYWVNAKTSPDNALININSENRGWSIADSSVICSTPLNQYFSITRLPQVSIT